MIQLSRFKEFRFLTLGLLMMVSVVVTQACNVATSSGLAGTDTLRIAIAPNYPPFTFKTAEGELQGFEIDLMNAFGVAQNLRIEFEQVSVFDEVIRQLYGKQVDAATAAITITPERQQIFSFSRPYFKSGVAIAVRESTTEITDLNSLKNKRIGVETGTIGADAARTIPGAEIIGYDSVSIAWKELLQGKVEAVISGETVTRYAISQGSVRGLKIAGDPIQEEFLGIATPKGSPKLETINSGLTQLINSGTYATIFRQWFDTEPPALPDSTPAVSS